jgi:hypothetical protein
MKQRNENTYRNKTNVSAPLPEDFEQFNPG